MIHFTRCPIHLPMRLRLAFVVGAVTVFLPWSGSAEPAKAKRETLLSVAISQIALMTLNAHVGAYGVVEAAGVSAQESLADARLSVPMRGVITSFSVVEGQQVEKGAALLSLDRRFTETGAAAPLTFVLVAPFRGVIAHLNSRVGELVDPSEPVVELIDPSHLVVTAHVPVDDVANLKLGRPVEISTNLANSKVLGSLLYISPVVDEKTGGVAVRASLPANSGLRPGQFVKLSLATEEHADILAVPVESLVKDPDVGYVIALIEGDLARQKPVRVGIRDGDFVEVEGEGVKVGQTVAAEGAYALPKETKVHVITPVD